MALRVWLPLNGDFHNQGLGTLSAPFSITGNTWEAGKIGNNLKIAKNKSNSVNLQEIVDKNILTCCLWFKLTPDSTFTAWQDLCSFGVKKVSSGSTGSMRLEVQNAAGSSVRWYANGLMATDTVSQTGNTTLGQWYHMALVITPTKSYTYFNGAYLGEWTLNNDFAFSGNIAIGDTGNIYCTLADFRVYDEALSAKQIKEISKCLVVHYPLKGTECNPNLLSNTKTFEGWSVGSGWIKTIESDGTAMYSFSRTGATANTWVRLIPTYHIIPSNFPNGVAVSFDFMVDDLDALNKQIICALQNYNDEGTRTSWVETNGLQYYINGDKVVSGQWIRLTKLWTQAELSQGTGTTYSTLSFQLVQNGSIHIKNIKCEAGNTPTSYIPNSAETKYTALGYDKVWIDEDAGYGYEGKQSGTLSFNLDSPKYLGSTKFDSGYLHYLPSPINTSTDAFTFTCWFYPTRNATMALYNDRTAVGDGFSVFYLGGGIRFDTGGSAQYQSGSITVNAWNFVACTFDKINNLKKTYINGVQAGSTSTIGSLAAIGANASIGNSSTNGAAGAGNQIYGSVSDVRIYATALSADDILTMYKNSGIIDNNGNVYAYEFKEE